MLKLDILPYVMNKSLSAGMIGDYNSANPKLYTEKLIGSVKACVEFVSSNQRYVPTLMCDIHERFWDMEYDEKNISLQPALELMRNHHKYGKKYY